MASVGDNNQNPVRGRKDLIINEGAPECFMCEKTFVSVKYLYGHISDDHSNNEWKTFLHNITTINIVGGHHRNLDTAVEILSTWKVKGKRGSSGLKMVKDDVKIDDELREVAESLILLVGCGHDPPPSKAAEPGGNGGCMVGHDHPSMAEPTIGEKLIQVEENDNGFDGGCRVVPDFDLNLDPPLTPMEDEDM